MEKFKLAFGIHNHQPVGNFDAVFEDAHQKAYLPFLELLASFDDFSISLHQSGILWDWQVRHHPNYLTLVNKMTASGRLELMTGGFYEPILSSIPERDAQGQIELLTGYLRDRFNIEPEGFWLTERIWEPHLPSLLSRAGVKWLPVDDTHFVYAGMQREHLTGPFVTENEGQVVTLLPIQTRLRYLIPFGTVPEVIEELKSQAEKNPGGMAIYADDGEKFGGWPGTDKHCYADGWLRSFFEAVSQNSDWLEIVPLSRAAKADPVGRAYLPSASYEEMLHWALPTEAFVAYEDFQGWLSDHGKKETYGRFVRGGHWRGFLAKYDESNLMHKKMLHVSDQLAALPKTGTADRAKIEAARDALYAGQCNCPYWHGVFGGLYLPHIRQAVYSKMIEAQRILRQVSSETGLSIIAADYDRDGHDEIICESDALTAVFKPNRGGMLLEWSLIKPAFNLTDTMSRRREGYHLKLIAAASAGGDNSANESASIHDRVLSKEEGLEKYLIEDWYLKRCLLDHFFAADVEQAAFAAGSFAEVGDFILEPYKSKLDRTAGQVTMVREGLVRNPEGAVPVRVEKQISFSPVDEEIDIRYELTSGHPGGVDVNFGIENSFNFQAGHADDRYLMVDNRSPSRDYLDASGDHAAASSIVLADEYRNLAAAVSSDRPGDIWHQPIFTVSLSEGGFERVYQGTTIVHRYRLHLSDVPQVISLRLLAGEPKSVLARAFAHAAVGS